MSSAYDVFVTPSMAQPRTLNPYAVREYFVPGSNRSGSLANSFSD